MLLWKEEMENFIISVLFPKEPLPQRAFCITSYKYLVVEHIGAMDKIYETYGKIYEEIIPSTSYIPIKDIILHFEKYDYRFHWNSDNSVIEIWIPIQD